MPISRGKSKFSPAVCNQILENIRNAMPMGQAAQLAGIGVRTFYRWRSKGREGDPRYKAFAEALDAAMAESERALLDKIYRAADDNWTAAAWILERRFPERYSRPIRIKIDDLDKAIELELAKVAARGEAGDVGEVAGHERLQLNAAPGPEV